MRSHRPFRPALWLTALVATGTLLTACSNSPSTPASSTTTTAAGHHGTGATTTTAPPSSTSTTQPAFPSSGAITAGNPIHVPLSAGPLTAAEAPDGSVFVATQAPGSPAPSIIYVVDGNGPAAIAEHFPSGIAALAADATNLYVATYSGVTAFSRTTGNQDGHWSVTVNSANSSDADLVSLVAAAGRVYEVAADQNLIDVWTMDPASSSAPTEYLQGLGSAAVGPDGTVYYALDGTLTSKSPFGSTKQGPALANTPNGEGGGVQYVDFVANNSIWVGEPAGQGLDAGWTAYDTTSLQKTGSFGGVASDQFVGTSGGELVVVASIGQSPCTAPSPGEPFGCISRISAAGTQSDSYAAANETDLLGPSPAFLETGFEESASEVFLVRLS